MRLQKARKVRKVGIKPNFQEKKHGSLQQQLKSNSEQGSSTSFQTLLILPLFNGQNLSLHYKQRIEHIQNQRRTQFQKERIQTRIINQTVQSSYLTRNPSKLIENLSRGFQQELKNQIKSYHIQLRHIRSVAANFMQL